MKCDMADVSAKTYKIMIVSSYVYITKIYFYAYIIILHLLVCISWSRPSGEVRKQKGLNDRGSLVNSNISIRFKVTL